MNHTIHLKKQLRCIYLSNFFSGLRITDAVWVALLAARGFSLWEIGLAESVYHIVSLLCEVPSGMAADLLGRKRALVAGGNLAVLSSLLMAFAPGLFLICAAMGLNALSNTMFSGTDAALTYDSLKQAGQEERYLSVAANRSQIGMLASALGSLASTLRRFLRFSGFYLVSALFSSISTLASNTPYTGSDYELLVGIDTNYPVTDLYARAHTAYLHRQHLYLTGFALTIFATIGLLLSFLFLFRVSGYQSYRSFDVTLHGFDKSGTETGIIFFAAMTAIALVVSDLILVRILHLVIPSQYWYFSDHSLQALVLYLGGLLLFFSLLRRYRAGTLWTSSLICRFQKKMAILKTRQNFRSRLGIGFVLYLAINTALISLAWYFWDRVYASLYVVYLLTGLTVLVFLLFNLWIFYILFRQAIEQESIRDAVQQLSTGETSYQLNLDEFDGPELTLAEGLNNISSGLETALQEKMKSERLKTNLITNVSHDIKTPLTSIINYVNLMKREHIEDVRINAYLDVLDQKSQRLKTLIEDLVEASKASSGNVKLEFTDIDLVQMAFQTNGEFEEKLDARHLQLIINAPRKPLMIRADGRRLWRVLENLYNNVCKYAMEGSRVYVDLARVPGNPETGTAGQAVFTIKNISANPLNIRADELTERFVRGDVARTTEGSGLGLSIAKDLTELQNGQFSLYIDGDLFKAQVAFDLVEKTTEKAVEDAGIIEETDASEAAEKPKKGDELKKTNIPEEATIQKEVNGESSENAINETINTTENSRNE